jgi:enamine deaminase RidA (YjgF/YER057c/UK114 family)
MALFHNQRTFCWPDGHWDWYRHLAFKHGVRCGDLIFVGGQVDKTPQGEPRNAGDLEAQTAVVVRHVATVLAGLGSSVADVTRLTAFYATDGSVSEQDFVADVGRHLEALGVIAAGEGPTIVPVPLPYLALPGMQVEIEAIAMCGGERRSVAGGATLPPPFVGGLRRGGHAFVGAQSAAHAPGPAFDALASVLEALGSGVEDLVRVGLWSGEVPHPDLAAGLDALDCATVALATPRLGPGTAARVDGWAMDRGAFQRRCSVVPDDWGWPSRRGRTKAVACGELVFVGGQLALDGAGQALHPGDLNEQTRLCMARTRAALAAFGLGLDHMVKQTSFYLGAANAQDIVTNQTLRSGSYTEPAGASTGVPLAAFAVPGAMVSVDTVAMR